MSSSIGPRASATFALAAIYAALPACHTSERSIQTVELGAPLQLTTPVSGDPCELHLAAAVACGRTIAVRIVVTPQTEETREVARILRLALYANADAVIAMRDAMGNTVHLTATAARSRADQLDAAVLDEVTWDGTAGIAFQELLDVQPPEPEGRCELSWRWEAESDFARHRIREYEYLRLDAQKRIRN
ncbi:MAG: hypothetical protein IT430_20045 [Phycisphaerales bacterium]|nr:hypothetical protein [Phycisphaerales bacterium]